MTKKKQKKGNVAKRQQKASQEKRRKRQQNLNRTKRDQQRVNVVERPPLSGMDPPEGFRTVSMSQALLEYGKPLMELTESEADLQGAMHGVSAFWNYSKIVRKDGKDPELAAMEKEMLRAIGKDFGMDPLSARELLEMMVERHGYLFPEEIQPRGTPFMFIRKEVSHVIEPIEDARIRISDEAIPPDAGEMKLFMDLGRLDSLDRGVDWDEIEGLLRSIKDPFYDAFRNWLVAKGLEDLLADDLAGCLFIWLDFIYAYGHDEETRLGVVPSSCWIDFFQDFLLRKMMVDPPKYAYWPPALKLFYRFLHEKEYLESHLEAERAIRYLEPGFFDLLRRQFS
jgi:hypothetical protein